MKQNLNKEKIVKFLNTEKGKKYLLVGSVCIIVGILWKLVLTVLIVIGIIYLIYNYRNKEHGKHKHPDT